MTSSEEPKRERVTKFCLLANLMAAEAHLREHDYAQAARILQDTREMIKKGILVGEKVRRA
jgi:hypothetical protein